MTARPVVQGVGSGGEFHTPLTAESELADGTELGSNDEEELDDDLELDDLELDDLELDDELVPDTRDEPITNDDATELALTTDDSDDDAVLDCCMVVLSVET